MKPSFLSTCLVLSVLPTLSTSAAAATGAHVHGAAAVDVVVDGSLLQVDLHSPLDSLVGFEHAPRNARQKKALQDAQNHLKRPETLFVPAAAARCKADRADIDMPFKDGHAHGSGKSHQHDHAPADGHSELHASMTFRCEAPDALNQIEFRLFDVFRGMERITVQLAAPKGQSSATLTPKRRTLSW